MNREYKEDFDCWHDVTRSYSISGLPEPSYIYATYSYEDYTGRSVVIYSDNVDGPYYVVEAYHCSCYGLEDQWGPTEHTRSDLIRAIGSHNQEAQQWAKETFNIT